MLWLFCSISWETTNFLSFNLFSTWLICWIGIIVRNTLVMYDRQHSKIGFWKTNCSELWERLHISGETPNRENSTAKIPPTLAPAEAPRYGLPSTLTACLQVSLYATLSHHWCLQMLVSCHLLSYVKMKFGYLNLKLWSYLRFSRSLLFYLFLT